jgi:hypothetical protein
MLLHIGLSLVLGHVVSDLPQNDQHVISSLTAEGPCSAFHLPLPTAGSQALLACNRMHNRTLCVRLEPAVEEGEHQRHNEAHRGDCCFEDDSACPVGESRLDRHDRRRGMK